MYHCHSRSISGFTKRVIFYCDFPEIWCPLNNPNQTNVYSISSQIGGIAYVMHMLSYKVGWSHAQISSDVIFPIIAWIINAEMMIN